VPSHNELRGRFKVAEQTSFAGDVKVNVCCFYRVQATGRPPQAGQPATAPKKTKKKEWFECIALLLSPTAD
jgi:hypothetical protein